MANGILSQIANPGLANKLLSGYQAGTQIAANRAQAELARQQAERQRIENMREDQVNFLESSTRQLMPALDVYKQDPITANKIYTDRLKSVQEAYPEYAASLPSMITRENYGQLQGMGQAALLDLDTRRKIMAERAKPVKGAYKPGELVEIKSQVGGEDKIVTTRYTPGAGDYGYGPNLVPVAEAGRFNKTSMVNIGIGEKEEQKAKVQIAQKDYEAVTQQGDTATRQLGSINQARAMLDDQAFITGKLEPIKAQLSAFAESVGVDPNQYGIQQATTPQQFNAVMNGLVLTKAQQMKGNLSDRDVRFLESSAANLGNTKDANRFLLDAANAMATMDKRKSEFYRDQFGKENVSLTEINNNWRKSPYNVPVVGKTPNGKPVFWTQYFNTMIEANSKNPDYYNSVTQSLDRQKLIEDISKQWKESYAIK